MLEKKLWSKVQCSLYEVCVCMFSLGGGGGGAFKVAALI